MTNKSAKHLCTSPCFPPGPPLSKSSFQNNCAKKTLMNQHPIIKNNCFFPTFTMLFPLVFTKVFFHPHLPGAPVPTSISPPSALGFCATTPAPRRRRPRRPGPRPGRDVGRPWEGASSTVRTTGIHWGNSQDLVVPNGPGYLESISV